MPDFNEMLELLQNGSEDVPETVYDDLRNEYQTRVDGATAALQARQEEIEKAQAEITRLKAMNFELLTSLPADNDGDGGEIGDDSDPAVPQNFGIDDLFRVQ